MMKKTLLFFCFIIIAPLLSHANPGVDALREVFEKGVIAYNQGNYDSAIKLFEATLEIYPDFAPSYNYLGLLHKAVGTDLNEVIWLFRQAIDIDPKYTEAYDNLGKTYYSLGHFDLAESTILKAIELNPNNIPAQVSLAWVYLIGKSEPQKAIPYFERAVREYQIPYAFLGLGMAYFMDGQRFRTLEMITELKQMGNEEMAKQLEDMVRDRSYVPTSIPGEPLANKSQRQGSVVPDNPTGSYGGDMKVRLRGRLNPTSRDLTLSDNPETTDYGQNEPVPSATERIREIRERSLANPAAAPYEPKGSH